MIKLASDCAFGKFELEDIWAQVVVESSIQAPFCGGYSWLVRHKVKPNYASNDSNPRPCAREIDAKVQGVPLPHVFASARARGTSVKPVGAERLCQSNARILHQGARNCHN
eukprot:5966704-Amphidinium_carterae.1